jgi:hypothetical protein
MPRGNTFSKLHTTNFITNKNITIRISFSSKDRRFPVRDFYNSGGMKTAFFTLS